jgi:hypothetical protein
MNRAAGTMETDMDAMQNPCPPEAGHRTPAPTGCDAEIRAIRSIQVARRIPWPTSVSRPCLNLAVAAGLLASVSGCMSLRAPLDISVSGRKVVLRAPQGMIQVLGRDKAFDDYWAQFAKPSMKLYAVFVPETTWTTYLNNGNTAVLGGCGALVIAPTSQAANEDQAKRDFLAMCEGIRERMAQDSSAAVRLAIRDAVDSLKGDPARLEGLALQPLSARSTSIAVFGVDGNALGEMRSSRLLPVHPAGVTGDVVSLSASALCFVHGRVLDLALIRRGPATVGFAARTQQEVEAWVRAVLAANHQTGLGAPG